MEKLLLDTRQSTAVTGVMFRRGGRQHVVRCNKEVIVSAGVVGSPKVLMLSGIGPRSGRKVAFLRRLFIYLVLP